MRPSKHIDEQIRLKMENLEAGSDPSSWELLAHRMDFEAQQSVDHLFETRLGSLSVPVASASWDAMEQMIEADEAATVVETEAQIDNVAYDKLNSLQVPYKDHHWALMAKRLEEEFSLRHKLYKYKVAEMALMSLLLLTLVRFLPLVEGGWTQYSPSAEQQRILEKPQSETSSISLNNTSQTLQASPAQNNLVAGTLIAAGTNKGANLTKPKIGFILPTVGSLNSGSPSTENGFLAESFSYAAKTYRFGSNPTSLNKELPLLEFSTASKARVKEIAERNTKQFNFMASKRQANPEAAALLPIGQVNSSYTWELQNVKTRPAKKHNDLRFGIFTTTDFNYVTTPPNHITVFGESVRTDYNETMASGYGGGVNVSWKRDRWEYQTGGIYSFKRYIPNTPIFIFDTPNFFIKEDFNGIQLDIFQVPLNALYHFKNTGKWHFYTSTGISAHFITSTVYEIDHKSQALRVIPNSSPDEGKSITNEDESSLEFPSGLLDGGKLHGNFYLSANLGIGVERYLSPKWTVFFQPNYQHFLMSEGIGDNKDKIYTTSFYLGTKFNLK